jgi:hypothetical protein
MRHTVGTDLPPSSSWFDRQFIYDSQSDKRCRNGALNKIRFSTRSKKSQTVVLVISAACGRDGNYTHL